MRCASTWVPIWPVQATASLIGAEPAELSHDDVRDAAGELANMTAGGIMELLPQPCQMSLPTVVMGTDFEVSVPQGVVLYSSVFDTPYGKFSVTVIRGEDHGQRLQHEKNCAPEVLRPGAVNSSWRNWLARRGVRYSIGLLVQHLR